MQTHQFFYSHGFHSSLNCAVYDKICKAFKIAPYQLVYDNGGGFKPNLLELKKQFLAHLERHNNIESKPDSMPKDKSNTTKSAPLKPNLESSAFVFIGNSLGAFYLWQLALFAKDLALPHPKAIVLFNPVLEPLSQLEKYINKPQTNATTNASFCLDKAAWQSYAESKRVPLEKDIKSLVFIAKDDELINSNVSSAYWQCHASKVVLIEGGHKIRDFTPFRDDITALLSEI